MNESDVRAAIADGATSRAEIAEFVGLNSTHVGRELKAMAEDSNNSVSRKREGKQFVYSVGPAQSHPEVRTPNDAQTDGGTATETAATSPANPNDERAESMPAVWSDELEYLDDVPRYRSGGDELEELNSEIDRRHVRNKPVRTILSGDTGTGKTNLARWIAYDHGWPMITIQGTPDLRPSDIIGTPVFSGSGSFYQPGPGTEALRWSQDGPVVLLFDEANRAPQQSKAALFEMLDDRESVTIPEIGNETIHGNGLDIILLATMNEGPGYAVQDLDMAERRRYGAKRYLYHLGDPQRGDPEAETDLLAERTKASYELAEKIVDCANTIRTRAKDSGDPIKVSVSTGTLLDWIRAAGAYHDSELENPIVRAGTNFVVNPWHEGTSKSEVAEVIDETFGGVGYDGELQDIGDADGSDTYTQMVCGDCGWTETKENAPASAIDFRECPNCGDGYVEEKPRTTPPETW